MRKRRTNMGWIPDRRMRHITFSKRRKGLFKKAQQLCRLTGATVGIVCFNEVGNPFTFVYPPLANANAPRSFREETTTRGRGRIQILFRGDNQQRPSTTSSSNDNFGASLEHGGGAIAFDPNSFDFGSSSGCVVEDEPGVSFLDQMQNMDEEETAFLDSVLGQPMVEEQGLVDSSVCLPASTAIAIDRCSFVIATILIWVERQS
ncbi:MADS-box transcription factor 30-like [Nymphaea colorata]|uniref:MADS-box transcription factor 30-like n=1 Tax=Nymphaea colorata TaxID=210225 RepID=UPI00129D3EEB|nr:MADS-box transcription factor 30-like [Nymphaea colorata]